MSAAEILNDFFQQNVGSTNKVAARVSNQMLNGEGKPTYLKHPDTMAFLTALVEYAKTH